MKKDIQQRKMKKDISQRKKGLLIDILSLVSTKSNGIIYHYKSYHILQWYYIPL